MLDLSVDCLAAAPAVSITFTVFIVKDANQVIQILQLAYLIWKIQSYSVTYRPIKLLIPPHVKVMGIHLSLDLTKQE